ncbi:hypothetical protein POSPLADRAFT_1151673, partial [Postia placenta MAD-698-R-SB12]
THLFWLTIGKIMGNPVLRMCWTPHTFHCHIHLCYSVELLLFTSLSKLPGGNKSLDKLLSRQRCDKLQFQHCKHPGVAPPKLQ